MNLHNTIQAYGRPEVKLSLTQLVRPRDLSGLYREAAGLIKGAGKVTCFALAFLIIGNYAIVSTITSIDLSIESLKDTRHTLLDKNIEHRAQKAYLNDPVNLGELVHDQLSLNPATREQVGVFDVRKGIFKQGQFDQETKTFVYL